MESLGTGAERGKAQGTRAKGQREKEIPGRIIRFQIDLTPWEVQNLKLIWRMVSR